MYFSKGGVELVSLRINGKTIDVAEGTSILKACEQAGEKIPTFCNDKRLVPHGACRICVVEVDKARTLVASCSTPATDGMVVYTHSEKVVNARKDILDLIWAAHDNDCLKCLNAGQCKLQDYCFEYEIETENAFYPKALKGHLDTSNEFYTYNGDKCILCGKCVRVCGELQGSSAIGFSERGHETHVTHPFEAGMTYSSCVSCSNCVNVCPTGALTEKSKHRFRAWDIEKRVKTTCTYCGVGCQINLIVIDNKVVRVEPAENGVNQGLLCVKGKFAFDFIGHQDRLRTPLIRKDGAFIEATWDEALDLVASRMKEIKDEYGAQALAALSSARCSTEDNYVMQKLFRAVIGTNSIDHCARL